MPFTDVETLKVFLKIPLIKIFIILMLLPSSLFGWLWYNQQQIILEQQKDCHNSIEKIRLESNKKTESIYQHFLEKTEKQIEVIREIQNKKLHEKVTKTNHRSGSS